MSQHGASPRRSGPGTSSTAQIRLLRGIKQSAAMIRLGELADVDVGIVTVQQLLHVHRCQGTSAGIAGALRSPWSLAAPNSSEI